MLIAPPEALVRLLKPWNDFYSHSKAAETAVTFLHVAGLLLAGGLAIAADRGTLRALRSDGGRRDHLRELAAIHRWVLAGLVIVVTSGLVLLASDIETFFGSGIFWTKMVLIIVLLVNGWIMTRAESTLGRDGTDHAPGWRTLHRAAVTSLGLWFTIVAFGVALVNFS